jgi:hypothetical protein
MHIWRVTRDEGSPRDPLTDDRVLILCTSRDMGVAQVPKVPAQRGDTAEADPPARVTCDEAAAGAGPARDSGGRAHNVGVARIPSIEDLTQPIHGSPGGPPVFVDATGRRRRLFRWLALGVAGLCLLAIALFWLSQTGPPIGPGGAPVKGP